MKVSEHIKHCIDLMAKFGDEEVIFFARSGDNYNELPRISFITGAKSRYYEISAGIRQFSYEA
jgi:hypothetical protein